MNIRELLSLVDTTAKREGASQPWIVGGVPRDKILNRLENVEDIDITTGDDTVHRLAKTVGLTLQPQGGNYRVLADGHAQITIGSLKLDFSSNYRDPEAEPLLKKAGVKNPSSIQLELFSRDFTTNCLLLNMNLDKISDPTGLGLTDMERKRLRTPLPARFTLGNDNKRVVRILYLAAKLGFDVDEEIIKWVQENPETIANVKQKYLSDKLQQAVNYDEKRTVDLLNKMGLWQYVPPLPALIPYMGKGLI